MHSPSEEQGERIRRLGQPRLWHGQDAFYYPIEMPCLEWFTIAAGVGEELGLRCAGCGGAFETPMLDGRSYGTRAVVMHQNIYRYLLYHGGCQPRNVPWVHEIWAAHRGAAIFENFGTDGDEDSAGEQLGLF